ncbi:hypothetical protein Ahy_B01g056145 [Arachis hypogaea]|uniref:Uncharacterized protein n=1 Tax=Arachis hypogaea TaxID=3818 RepID=A0A445AY24_ARAHY|nr:hypothetical protein Ahy_B01g056145 [Arachis hypogaea]
MKHAKEKEEKHKEEGEEEVRRGGGEETQRKMTVVVFIEKEEEESFIMVNERFGNVMRVLTHFVDEHEKKCALAAQYAAETTLTKIYANQKDDDSLPIDSIIASFDAEIKIYKNEQSYQ